MMGEILDIVVEVLKTDEDQGTQALESLIELTQSFGEIWNASSVNRGAALQEILTSVREKTLQGRRPSNTSMVSSIQ